MRGIVPATMIVHDPPFHFSTHLGHVSDTSVFDYHTDVSIWWILLAQALLGLVSIILEMYLGELPLLRPFIR